MYNTHKILHNGATILKIILLEKKIQSRVLKLICASLSTKNNLKVKDRQNNLNSFTRSSVGIMCSSSVLEEMKGVGLEGGGEYNGPFKLLKLKLQLRLSSNKRPSVSLFPTSRFAH